MCALYPLNHILARWWLVGPGDLPEWITEKRAPDAEAEAKRPSRLRWPVRLLPLAALVAAGGYLALELPAAFHLPVIGAGVYSFALAVFSRLQLTRVSLAAYAGTAVALNGAVVAIAGALESELSGTIAAASTMLFTGAVGLLLVARTEKRPSRPVKASMMAAMAAACVAGPAMYLMGWDGGGLELVTFWLLVAAIPLTVLAFGMLFVLSAHHESEQTLPSDKWV
jgi:hypothetical protein